LGRSILLGTFCALVLLSTALNGSLFFHPLSSVFAEQDLFSLPAKALTPSGDLFERGLLGAVSPRQTITTDPGQTISLTVNYQIWQGGNPTELDQLFLIASWTPSWPPPPGYYYPVYNSVPRSFPGYTGTSILSIAAPTTLGTYYLWFCSNAEYNMQDAANAYRSPLKPPAHVRIIVRLPLLTVLIPLTAVAVALSIFAAFQIGKKRGARVS